MNWHPKFFHHIESRIQSLEGQLEEVLKRLGVSQEEFRQIGLQKTDMNSHALTTKANDRAQKDSTYPRGQQEAIEQLNYVEEHLLHMPFAKFLIRVRQLERAKARVHFAKQAMLEANLRLKATLV
jgi:hypothetical protein